LTADERRAKAEERKERVRERTRKKKLAYPIVGGPLDGQHALTEDFESGWRGEPEGMYYHLRSEYIEFNAAGGTGRKRAGGFPPSMIYVHKSVLKPLLAGRER
jgi:hypothetical protein